ncbi:MAG: NAD(P)H-binding protein [Chloroflexi bacterium]|nr:NAD(P)H-binding protein [Chloroflexota bacterium]
MARRNWNRIFVTGGTSFVGLRVIAALVEEGADITVLVQPDSAEKLGPLRRHVRLEAGDVWNNASLKGRSRGYGAVIHLVGSTHAQPARGLTFQQLNLVPARNVIGMAVGDGVPYVVLLSAVSSPSGVSAEYLRSKREAEEYLRNSGLNWAIVRAPVLFDRRQRGGGFFILLSRVGALPFLRVFFGRKAPLPVDVASRAIARLALEPDFPRNQLLYAGNLRRLGRAKRNRQHQPKTTRSRRQRSAAASLEDDNVPFGWLPGKLPDNPGNHPGDDRRRR